MSTDYPPTLKSKNWLILPILVIYCLSGWQQAYADCIGVGCTCSVEADPVAFGAYDPLSSSNVDSTGNVEVTCSALVASLNVSYVISLDTGNGGSFQPRSLSNGTSTLNYNLYSDATRSTVWGDGTNSTSTVSDSYILNLFSETRNYPVYGRVPGLQNVTTGNYNDTITVTVEY